MDSNELRKLRIFGKILVDGSLVGEFYKFMKKYHFFLSNNSIAVISLKYKIIC